MSEVLSFAEETCWKGEQFREVRKRVVFRVFSIGRNLGFPFNFEFESDYALWYCQDDDDLLAILREKKPDIPWNSLVYHKKLDHSGIDVYETENDRLVARIEVRHHGGSRLPEEALTGDNVIRFQDIPLILSLRGLEEFSRLALGRKRRKRRDRDRGDEQRDPREEDS